MHVQVFMLVECLLSLQVLDFLCQLIRKANDPKCRRSAVAAEGPSASVYARAEAIRDKPTQVLDIKSIKPTKALQMLREDLRGDPSRQEAWLADARVAAIMGSCPRSKACFRSGLKHWLGFIEATRGAEQMDRHAFPPLLSDVLAWSNVFACLGEQYA